MLKKLTTVLVLILITGYLTVSEAINPHHHLTIAMENGVRKTVDGEREYQKAIGYGFERALFYFCDAPDADQKKCQNDYWFEPKSIIKSKNKYFYIHGKYMTRSFQDRIDILKEALEEYNDRFQL